MVKDCFECDFYERHKNNPDRFYCTITDQYFDWDDTIACSRYKNSLEESE